MGLFKCFKSALKFAFFGFIFVCAIHLWLTTKDYIFTENDVAAIALKHIKGKDVTAQQKFDKIYREFAATYPGHILPSSDLQWIFINAGGWMGSMCLLHASVTEYVLFFGTPMDTRGHSGRYWANVSDTLIAGEFEQWKEGTLQTTIHKPGDTVLHAWGETTAVHFGNNTWMVEYGRGFIPSTLGFALADTFFSTTDFMTLYYILKVYAKAMCQELSFNSVYYLDLLRKFL